MLGDRGALVPVLVRFVDDAVALVVADVERVADARVLLRDGAVQRGVAVNLTVVASVSLDLLSPTEGVGDSHISEKVTRSYSKAEYRASSCLRRQGPR
jgi:hypothetical protein